MKYLFIFFIKIYQKCISPYLSKRCNFEPTCSQYAIDAIKTYGIFKGTCLALKRIIGCSFNKEWKYDPVKKKN